VAGLFFNADKGDRPPVDGYQVVNAFPHDPKAYSQGLAYADGVLYEGTGQYGQSSLRRVDLKSGRVTRFVRLNERLFGEGIVVLDDRIIQLTWKNRTGLVFDRQTMNYRRSFRYSGEGWGITEDGRHLIISDGSSTLRFLDPKTFRVVKRLAVKSGGRRVDNLNELEFVEGEIYANVWGADYIARISPDSGEVLGWIDLAGLFPSRQRPSAEAVLNGIAYDRQGKRLFVTGKLWPKLYEIRVVPKR